MPPPHGCRLLLAAPRAGADPPALGPFYTPPQAIGNEKDHGIFANRQVEGLGERAKRTSSRTHAVLRR